METKLLDLPDGEYIARNPKLKALRFFRIINGEFQEGVDDQALHDICKSTMAAVDIGNVNQEGLKYDA